MGKNTVVISSTLRKNGNSQILAKEFARAAKDAGNNVEFISLIDKEIKFCKGCLACQKTQKCVINDDSNKIVEKMKNADVIVFASPIYYYEMSGQLKTLLDRANPLFASDYKFRDIYFLASAADSDIHAMDTALNGIKGWISCFANAKLKGSFLLAGVEEQNEALNRKQDLAKVYEIGKNI